MATVRAPAGAEPAEAEVVDSVVEAKLDIAAIVAQVEQGLLRGPRRYNRLEISERAGVTPDEARRLWRALGFATVESDDELLFTDGDLEALRKTQVLADHGIAEPQMLLAMTRMLGQTFSRLAE